MLAYVAGIYKQRNSKCQTQVKMNAPVSPTTAQASPMTAPASPMIAQDGQTTGPKKLEV